MIIHCSLLLCLVDPIQYTYIKSCFIQSWSLLSNEDLDLKQVQPREKPDWLSDVEVRFESVRAFIWVWYPFRFVSGDLQKESTGYNDDILYMIIWYNLYDHLFDINFRFIWFMLHPTFSLDFEVYRLVLCVVTARPGFWETCVASAKISGQTAWSLVYQPTDSHISYDDSIIWFHIYCLL